MKNKPIDWVPRQDQFLTCIQAAEYLQIPIFKIRRAVKAGLLPSYRLFDSRRYVKLCDILERMSAAD